MDNSSKKINTRRSIIREICLESVSLIVEDKQFSSLGECHILDFTGNGMKIKSKFPLVEYDSYRFCAPAKLAKPFFGIVCWTRKDDEGYQHGIRLVQKDFNPIYDLLSSGRRESRRDLNRISLEVDKTLSIELQLKSENTKKLEIVDYHSKAISFRLPTELQTIDEIVSYTIYFGNVPLIHNKELKVVRTTPDNIIVLSLEEERIESLEINSIQLKEWFRPQIVARDPFKIDQNIFLSVVNLSFDCLVAETSLSNKHLLHGLTLENSLITLPTIGEITVSLKVSNINISDSGRLHLHCSFQDLDKAAISKLIKYLYVGAAEKSELLEKLISDMRAELQIQKEYGSALRIEHVITPQDYLEALQIRLEAYHADGRHKVMKSKYDMADSYDDISLILIARLGEKCVATIRCVPTDANSPRFPFEDSIPLPKEYESDRFEYFELSKLAVLPEYRKSDVRVKIMQEMTSKVLSNKKGAFCTATPKNSKYYLQTGAVKISEEVQHPINAHETYALYLYSTESFLKGRHMSSTAWYKFALGSINFVANWNIVNRPRRNPLRFIRYLIEGLYLRVFKKK